MLEGHYFVWFIIFFLAWVSLLEKSSFLQSTALWYTAWCSVCFLSYKAAPRNHRPPFPEHSSQRNSHVWTTYLLLETGKLFLTKKLIESWLFHRVKRQESVFIPFISWASDPCSLGASQNVWKLSLWVSQYNHPSSYCSGTGKFNHMLYVSKCLCMCSFCHLLFLLVIFVIIVIQSSSDSNINKMQDSPWVSK